VSKSKGSKAEQATGGRTANAKSISSTEKTPKVKAGSGGLPSSYFGNSRACGSTEKGKK
jgi:hypothetical protein